MRKEKQNKKLGGECVVMEAESRVFHEGEGGQLYSVLLNVLAAWI